jgi:hypothetical protein
MRGVTLLVGQYRWLGHTLTYRVLDHNVEVFAHFVKAEHFADRYTDSILAA